MTRPRNEQHPSTSPIRAVILDYGEVISQSPDPEAIAAMAGIFAVPDEQFRHLYSATRPAYDRGDLDALNYWSGIAQAAGVELGASQIANLRQTDVAMWSKVRPAMLRWVQELRSVGVKTALLSNMHHDMVQKLRNDGDWTENFDCLTLSSAIRMAKPDAEIFWHCLGCLGVEPQAALFVDDREPNVRTARALGLQGIVADSPEVLRIQLAAIGFMPLPE